MPTWKHDCIKCKFLGQTIGGGKIFDLYVHGDTVLARFSNTGEDYYSILATLAHPNGHAELWAAASILKQQSN